jgi:hypothetical protein
MIWTEPCCPQDGIDKVTKSSGLAWYLSIILTVGNTLNRYRYHSHSWPHIQQVQIS